MNLFTKLNNVILKLTFFTSFFTLTSTLFSQTQDYTEYHQTIAKAEEELVNANFKESLLLYKNCFKKYDFVFAKDAYNSCQIAAYLNSKADFDSTLILTIKQGVNLSLLQKTPLINKKLMEFPEKYKSYYEKYRNVYLSKINLKLRAEFYKRHKEEQESKHSPNLNTFRTVVTSNYNRIYSLTVKDSFPGERTIGLDYGNFNPKLNPINSDFDIGNNFTYSTLLHYPYSYTNMETYLLEAIKKGITTPEYVAYLYGFEQTRTGVLYNKNIKYDSVKYAKCYNYPFGIKSEKLDIVNLNRKTIGLCSYETDEKKPDFEKKYGFILK